MDTAQRSYHSEEELVDALCLALGADQGPWSEISLTREFGYKRGRTDVVAVDGRGRILAFEAKLMRWREALQQAYRNTCYAHLSYVVLPEETARRAERYCHEFERRAVGLCFLRQGDLLIAVPAKYQHPIQPWLSQTAAGCVRQTNDL